MQSGKLRQAEQKELHKVKRIVRCNILKTVNSFLESGDWILIGIEQFRGRCTYLLGLISEK